MYAIRSYYEQSGERLDRVLGTWLPELGLRGRRRLCETGRVLLNGRSAAPGVRVHAGQDVRLLDDDAAGESPAASVVSRSEDYAALSKPAGLHSAALAGGGGASAEAALSALFPDATGDRAPFLCNRLDRATSGLLLVAFGDAAREAFRRAEDSYNFV